MPRSFYDHTRHLLLVSGLEAPVHVMAFEGEEHLSQPYCYHIEFAADERHIGPEQVLNQRARLELHAAPAHSDGTPLRTLQGVVTGFKRLGSSADQGLYSVTLEPRLALLGRGCQQRLYLGLNVEQIVREVLKAHNGWQDYDFRFQLARQYAPREQVIQFGESDLAFIQRLLAEVGIWYHIEASEGGFEDVVYFHDDQAHYRPPVSLPYVPQAGMANDGEDAVWGLQAEHQVVERAVLVRHYDYLESNARPCQPITAEADHAQGDATTHGLAYHLGDRFGERGSAVAKGPELHSPGAFFSARLQHERYLNRQHSFTAVTSSATLAAGHRLMISGQPLAGAPQGLVITRVAVKASREAGLYTRLTAMPYSLTVCFRPPLRPKPVMAGTLPARVARFSRERPYADLDRHGRYRVRFFFDTVERAPGKESQWLRLARPYGGDTYGLHLPLIGGTEVAIAFEHGDPDRPYIAHALHDAYNNDHVTLANEERNVLRTPTNNKLRLDDTRGQEHIKLSTEYAGKSQLNLGHLVDQHKARRGEGFELRTDAWGALRAGKGLFISAHPQPRAQGEVLDMSSALAMVESAQRHLEQCQAIAQAHHSPVPAAEGLGHLHGQARQLAGAALVLSAPQGVAATSGENLLLGSSASTYLRSGEHLHAVAAERLSLQAHQGISLLAREEGMRLVSGSGPLQVEAHGNLMALAAQGELSVQSTQGEVRISARKGISLGCGGGVIRILENGDIQLHTPGELSLKGRHTWRGPQGAALALGELPQSVCKQCLENARARAAGLVLQQEGARP